MHCLCAASFIIPTFLVRIKTGFESNPSLHRIADLLQEDVVVAKSLVENHHTSPRSALIKIVVKKEKETVRQSTHRGSSIRRKETVIKGDKIERRRSDANSSVVATTKEKYGMLNFDM